MSGSEVIMDPSCCERYESKVAALEEKVLALEAQNTTLMEDLDTCAATLARVQAELARALEANMVSVHRASQMAVRAEAAESALQDARKQLQATKEKPR